MSNRSCPVCNVKLSFPTRLSLSLSGKGTCVCKASLKSAEGIDKKTIWISTSLITAAFFHRLQSEPNGFIILGILTTLNLFILILFQLKTMNVIESKPFKAKISDYMPLIAGSIIGVNATYIDNTFQFAIGFSIGFILIVLGVFRLRVFERSFLSKEAEKNPVTGPAGNTYLSVIVISAHISMYCGVMYYLIGRPEELVFSIIVFLGGLWFVRRYYQYKKRFS